MGAVALLQACKHLAGERAHKRVGELRGIARVDAAAQIRPILPREKAIEKGLRAGELIGGNLLGAFELPVEHLAIFGNDHGENAAR